MVVVTEKIVTYSTVTPSGDKIEYVVDKDGEGVLYIEGNMYGDSLEEFSEALYQIISTIQKT